MDQDALSVSQDVGDEKEAEGCTTVAAVLPVSESRSRGYAIMAFHALGLTAPASANTAAQDLGYESQRNTNFQAASFTSLQCLAWILAVHHGACITKNGQAVGKDESRFKTADY